MGPAGSSTRRNTRLVAATAAAAVVVALLATAYILRGRSCTTAASSPSVPPGYVFEPSGEVGPHAFTSPVDTNDSRVCDKQALLAKLQARPEAYREWARVLGVPEADVSAYVASLRASVLQSDLPVTNHGLKDGHAYPRSSVLGKGTAVLVDPVGWHGAPAGTPVTRCKCGNPLLPPPPTSSTTTSSTTSSTTTTTTTHPGSSTSSTTTSSTTTSSTTTSSTTTSSTTTTTTTYPLYPPGGPD